MASHTRPKIFRLNPDYDLKGNSPWHWLQPRSIKWMEELRQEPVSQKWKAPIGDLVCEKKLGDFLYWSGGFVCGASTFQKRSPLIQNELELLPIKVRKSIKYGRGNERVEVQPAIRLPEQFYLHSLTFVELAEHKSEFKCFRTGAFMDIRKYAFFDGDLDGKHFFQIRGWGVDLLVSEAFKKCVEAAGLTGLSFRELQYEFAHR